MLWRTHLAMGLGAGYLIVGPDPLLLAAAGVGSLIPDLDHPNSFIGCKVPVAPRVTRMVLGHRGALHSILAAIAVGVIVSILHVAVLGIPEYVTGLGQYLNFILGKRLALAVVTGYLAHLAGDLFTRSGLPLLWPLPIRFRVPLVKTGSFIERLLVFPAVILGLIYWAVRPPVAGILGGVTAWFR